jgi:hypothetical protein
LVIANQCFTWWNLDKSVSHNSIYLAEFH